MGQHALGREGPADRGAARFPLALDATDDEQVAEHRHQGIGADIDQRPLEGTGGGDDVADDDGGGDGRRVYLAVLTWP